MGYREIIKKNIDESERLQKIASLIDKQPHQEEYDLSFELKRCEFAKKIHYEGIKREAEKIIKYTGKNNPASDILFFLDAFELFPYLIRRLQQFEEMEKEIKKLLEEAIK